MVMLPAKCGSKNKQKLLPVAAVYIFFPIDERTVLINQYISTPQKAAVK
jgi:hypothetical protein